jgi:trk system potassium uptake protein TrkH
MNAPDVAQRVREFMAQALTPVKRITPPQKRTALVGSAFLGSAFIATLLFWLPVGLTQQTMSFGDAWYLAVSALTASGATIQPIATTLTPAGMWLVLILLHGGGAGFMSITIGVLQRLGVPIFAHTKIRGWRLFAAVLLIEAWAGALLGWHWRGLYDSLPQAFFAGLFHATSAFANAGFDWMTVKSPLLPMMNDLPSLAIIGTTVMIGSLGLPVIVDVISQRRKLAQTTISLSVMGLLLAGGVVSLLLSPEWQSAHAQLSWGQQVLYAAFDALAWRTAGIFQHDDVMQLPVLVRIGLLVAMFVGCAPGSMGGGVTPTTVVVMLLAGWNIIRQRRGVHLFGQTLPQPFVRRAAIILVSGVVVVCVSALLIALIDHVALDRAVVLATAAFATTSVNDTTGLPLSGVVTTILSVGMLWGRVGVFLIVSAFYGEKIPKNVQKQAVWLG